MLRCVDLYYIGLINRSNGYQERSRKGRDVSISHFVNFQAQIPSLFESISLSVSNILTLRSFQLLQSDTIHCFFHSEMTLLPSIYCSLLLLVQGRFGLSVASWVFLFDLAFVVLCLRLCGLFVVILVEKRGKKKIRVGVS
ncbi:uncharacterized protein LOC112090756 [Morus notabilis]|uniref:uncharacterized protein LOC112090756 n=1 Tax=Morus notabilis TaxID=981085 RepID=UPI000CED2438|nr:uncharacterized protein LOC112090756 [Morus notabilis]